MVSKVVYYAAQGLLARREHSKLELKQKLSRKDHDLESILTVIELLAEKNIQSDERFAEACFRSRVKKGYGPNYIRQYLTQKGINDTLTHQIVSESTVNWFECIERVWKKKYSEISKDIKIISKQKQFLYYRGFTSELINQWFNELN